MKTGEPPAASPSRRAAAAVGALALAAVLAVATLGAWWVLRDPRVVFLVPEGGAVWIRYRAPLELKTRSRGDVITIFRTRVKANRPLPHAVVTVRALRVAAVHLDGRLVHAPRVDLDRWKSPLRVDLGPLSPGEEHEIRVVAANRDGPAALLMHSEALGLFTNASWEASRDQQSWTPAEAVDEDEPLPFGRSFPSVAEAFRARLPVALAVSLLVFAGSLARDLWAPASFRRLVPGPSGIRWVLLGAWGVLAINNFAKLPINVGFDARAHLEYILYVAAHHRLPLASEGWQMFQAPFYYAVSASLLKGLAPFFDEETVVRLLRVVPMLCGMGQVQLCYLASRYAFPDRNDLQGIGTWIGGLLPMSLYASQGLGNEPAAAFLMSASIVLLLRLNREGPAKACWRRLAILGGVLGLAMLTKATAIILVPLILVAAAWALASAGWPARRIAAGVGVLLVTSMAVCGWYYARNWITLGHPFVLAGGTPWWQDPGYRTPAQLLRFGESLAYPIFSGVHGLWDSLYSTMWLDGFLGGKVSLRRAPPWNWTFLLAGAWLSLVPATALILGCFRALVRPARAAQEGTLFAAGCLAAFLAALAYLYLTVPTYSTGKATYALGLAPCIAILCAGGSALFLHGPVSRAATYALLATWGLFSYAAYLVR